MRVNFGGDQGRDDYGLPPVDIEIPDDARELDRDVHAYYRELRAQQRRMLARRLCAPLSRDGMVLPLLAGCLALTLLAGTLLTVLTTGQGVRPPPAQTTSSPGTAHLGPVPGAVGSLLPDQSVSVNGQQQPLRQLARGVLVLALIPTGCQCLPGVRQLARRARQAGAKTFLVGTQARQLITLSYRVGLGRSFAAVDSRNALSPFYRRSTLSALLVRAGGRVVSVSPNPVRDSRFLKALKSLAATTPASPPPASTKVLRRHLRAVPVSVTLDATGG
jgi:hypothetical protein